MSAAITFDFHNTLVRCDRWFDLEVRSLPAVVAELLDGKQSPKRDNELTIAYGALRKEIIEHGRELSSAAGVIEAFRRVERQVDDVAVGACVDEVMAEVVADAELLPGVADTLGFLVARDVALGIVSSAVHHEFLVRSLARLGELDSFKVVVTSASAGFYKSRPEIYAAALSALGANAAQSVHVGDSYRFDHLAARGAGLATAWLRRPGAEPLDGGPPPDLELETLEGAGPKLLELLLSRQGTSGAH